MRKARGKAGVGRKKVDNPRSNWTLLDVADLAAGNRDDIQRIKIRLDGIDSTRVRQEALIQEQKRQLEQRVNNNNVICSRLNKLEDDGQKNSVGLDLLTERIVRLERSENANANTFSRAFGRLDKLEGNRANPNGDNLVDTRMVLAELVDASDGVQKRLLSLEKNVADHEQTIGKLDNQHPHEPAGESGATWYGTTGMDIVALKELLLVSRMIIQERGNNVIYFTRIDALKTICLRLQHIATD